MFDEDEQMTMPKRSARRASVAVGTGVVVGGGGGHAVTNRDADVSFKAREVVDAYTGHTAPAAPGSARQSYLQVSEPTTRTSNPKGKQSFDPRLYENRYGDAVGAAGHTRRHTVVRSMSTKDRAAVQSHLQSAAATPAVRGLAPLLSEDPLAPGPQSIEENGPATPEDIRHWLVDVRATILSRMGDRVMLDGNTAAQSSGIAARHAIPGNEDAHVHQQYDEQHLAATMPMSPGHSAPMNQQQFFSHLRRQAEQVVMAAVSCDIPDDIAAQELHDLWVAMSDTDATDTDAEKVRTEKDVKPRSRPALAVRKQSFLQVTSPEEEDDPTMTGCSWNAQSRRGQQSCSQKNGNACRISSREPDTEQFPMPTRSGPSSLQPYRRALSPPPENWLTEDPRKDSLTMAANGTPKAAREQREYQDEPSTTAKRSADVLARLYSTKTTSWQAKQKPSLGPYSASAAMSQPRWSAVGRPGPSSSRVPRGRPDTAMARAMNTDEKRLMRSRSRSTVRRRRRTASADSSISTKPGSCRREYQPLSARADRSTSRVPPPRARDPPSTAHPKLRQSTFARSLRPDPFGPKPEVSTRMSDRNNASIRAARQATDAYPGATSRRVLLETRDSLSSPRTDIRKGPDATTARESTPKVPCWERLSQQPTTSWSSKGKAPIRNDDHQRHLRSDRNDRQRSIQANPKPTGTARISVVGEDFVTAMEGKVCDKSFDAQKYNVDDDFGGRTRQDSGRRAVAPGVTDQYRHAQPSASSQDLDLPLPIDRDGSRTSFHEDIGWVFSSTGQRHLAGHASPNDAPSVQARTSCSSIAGGLPSPEQLQSMADQATGSRGKQPVSARSVGPAGVHFAEYSSDMEFREPPTLIAKTRNAIDKIMAPLNKIGNSFKGNKVPGRPRRGSTGSLVEDFAGTPSRLADGLMFAGNPVISHANSLRPEHNPSVLRTRTTRTNISNCQPQNARAPSSGSRGTTYPAFRAPLATHIEEAEEEPRPAITPSTAVYELPDTNIEPDLHSRLRAAEAHLRELQESAAQRSRTQHGQRRR